jgi:hypothetical protein
VNEFELPVPQVPVENPPVPATDSVAETPRAAEVPATPAPAVDPVRSAAGRLGGRRVHQLADFGRLYEQEHRLTPGRQRLKQLIQLGKRYEQEHGLRIAKPRRKRKGDAWKEFLVALSRVIKPAYRPAVEQLVASLSQPGVAGEFAKAG